MYKEIREVIAIESMGKEKLEGIVEVDLPCEIILHIYPVKLL